jgi:hypothetical protein
VVTQPRNVIPSKRYPEGSGPVNGRIFIIATKMKDTEPRLVSLGGRPHSAQPFWGMDVTHFGRGDTTVLRDGAGGDPRKGGLYGYPRAKFSQLPAGKYFVQALFVRYTRYHRADGKTVWLESMCGEVRMPLFPGNLYSDVQHVRLNPRKGGTFHFRLTHETAPTQPIPPGGTCLQGNPPDTAHVKHVKIKSALLSKFWGTPMYLGADIVLPKGYDDPANANEKYPLVIHESSYPQPGPGEQTNDFTEDPSKVQQDDPIVANFSKYWMSDQAPRVLLMEIRQQTPYEQQGYSVNTANNGPYGDAINRELLPAVEKQFRSIAQPWARIAFGGSTGGWETLGTQLFYPDVYRGAFPYCPDPPNFHQFQLVDVYHDRNAFYNITDDGLKTDQPSTTFIDEFGTPIDLGGNKAFSTMAQENHLELAKGTHGRAHTVWSEWQATFSPVGPDGYPAPIYDFLTGRIDHKVAMAWQAMDLTHYLVTNWPKIGPMVSGNVEHTYDHGFYFDGSSDLFEKAAARLTNPPANFVVHRNVQFGHCGDDTDTDAPESPANIAALWNRMTDHIVANAPAGADLSWRNQQP